MMFVSDEGITMEAYEQFRLNLSYNREVDLKVELTKLENSFLKRWDVSEGFSMSEQMPFRRMRRILVPDWASSTSVAFAEAVIERTPDSMKLDLEKLAKMAKDLGSVAEQRQLRCLTLEQLRVFLVLSFVQAFSNVLDQVNGQSSSQTPKKANEITFEGKTALFKKDGIIRLSLGEGKFKFPFFNIVICR